VGVVISPKVKLPSDALGRTAIPLVCGAALLLAAAGLAGEFREIEPTVISWKSILGLAYLVVFGSIIAFTSYTWLLQRCPPALVATHTYVNPLVAMLLGWLVVSEPLTSRVVIASAVILAAIVLVRRGERRAVPSTPDVAVAAETEPASLSDPIIQPALTGNDRLPG
jgi:drug/metabolite transporter (DMT)-like permease